MALKDFDLKQFLQYLLREHGEKRAFSILRSEWQGLTYCDVIDLTLMIRKELEKFGLKKNENIAILLDSCPEYMPAFFASGLLDHTTLLLDAKLTPEEMKHILVHSDSKLIITGFGAKQATQKLIDVLDEKMPVFFVDEVKKSGRNAAELETELMSLRGLQSKDTAVLCYTSGTTSEPKGVMLSLESLFFNCQGVSEAQRPNKDPVLLSILPMNHMLEFNGGIMLQLYLGSNIVFANTLLPNEIMERLQVFKYTDMIVVPLFLRSIRSALMRQVDKSIGKRIYFKIAFALARLIPSKSFRRKLFKPVIQKFGGLQRFVCGGAALEFATQEFFTLMGITVCQGYGLTETAPVATVTFHEDTLLGTQGRALPGTELKIDNESGEILIRGLHVMKGYYKKPELTAQVFTADGWFKSGDIGHLDKKGNLFITGRLKELIVLGNGKKVFPDEVESIMPVSGNIKEIIIVGAQEKSGPLQNTEAVCAVIVPTEELVKSSDELTIRELLEKEVRKHSEKIAAYKRPSKIYLSYQELPKTNTRKNKRMLIKRMIEEGVFA
jgi:long-chain acyl-CoA synthetase